MYSNWQLKIFCAPSVGQIGTMFSTCPLCMDGMSACWYMSVLVHYSVSVLSGFQTFISKLSDSETCDLVYSTTCEGDRTLLICRWPSWISRLMRSQRSLDCFSKNTRPVNCKRGSASLCGRGQNPSY